jgi:excinuclease UvrABC nuclease subunit
VQVLEAFIAQHYLGTAMPHTLVTSHAVGKAAARALTEQTGAKVNAVHQPREHRRIWLEMAQKNADIALARLLAEEGSQQARTRALAEALGLPDDDSGWAAHRVLRHLAHCGRIDPGVLRGLRGPQDAERAVPPLQHRRHHRR